MRYIIFLFILLACSRNVNAQTVTQPGLRDYQISGANLPDSVLYILGTDTLDGSAKQGLGKFHRADTLFARFGDHDFYGLGTGRSPVFGEDSIETALDSMYVLFKGLSGGLVTKIEMLQNGVLQFDQEDGTPARAFMSVLPLQQSEDNPPFQFNLESSTSAYGDQNNDVLSFGWNLGPGGTRIDATKHAMGLSFENNFIQSASDTMAEFHYRVVDLSGVEHRIYSYITDIRDFSSWYGYQTLAYSRINNPIDNNKFFEVAADATNHSFFGLYGSGSVKGLVMEVYPSSNYATFANYAMTTPDLYMQSWNNTYLNKITMQGEGTNPAAVIVGREAGTELLNVVTYQSLADSIETYISIPGDSDWFESGGTPPNAITDAMYHTGNVHVGDNTMAGSGALNVTGLIDQHYPTISLENIVMGSGAGDGSMTGTLNIGMGQNALGALTDGNGNIGIGYAAGDAITGGDFSTMIGYEAGTSYTGNNGIAIGYQAMQTNVSGTGNMAIGDRALKTSTGNDNLAIGNQAMQLTTTGSGNVAIGNISMITNTQGSNNVAVGFYSGLNNVLGDYNTLIGGSAGYSASTSDNDRNTIIGNQAGFSMAGDGNIFIGFEAAYNETGSNKLYIENSTSSTPLIGGDFAADTLRINGDLSIRDAVSGASTDSVLVWTPSNGRVKMRNAAAFGGSGATDLSISQSGGTQVIQSSTGTDVGVRNLYGLLITEGVTDTLHFRVDSSLFATTYDLTQIPISSLKAATKINTIDNTTYKQEWKWDGIAGTDGLKLSAITTAAASDLQKLLNVSLSGTNGTSGQDTWAGYFSNDHAGTTSTNYGLYGAASGGTSANYGVYGVANGSNGNGVVGTSSANIGVLGIGAIGVYASATSVVGVDANATSGIAIQGTATSGTGLEAIVTSGIPISVIDNSAGTNTVEPMIQMYHSTSGTAAAGIGSSIVYNTEANDGSDYVSTSLKSLWTTATAGSRVSNFVVSGVTAATESDILTMKGSGQMQLNKYVSGAFTGTAVNDLFIDASGNVIVGSMTGQSWTVDADDATTPILVSNQTLAFRGNRGINTDLIDGAVDSVSLVLDFSELVTVTTIDSDDNFAIWDAGTGMEEKITYANLITDIIADIPGGSDTHFGGDNLTWDANRVHDQSTFTTEIGGTNMSWKFQDNNATAGATIILAGNVGNSDAPMGQIQFMYDDAAYATDQTAWTMVATRETDDLKHHTLEITANEAGSSPPVATWEMNESLSDNTQETSLRLNSGIAYTQYWESSGANAITLDRGYYNIVLLPGHTGTITLPEIYGIDESNIEIPVAEVPIGQEYVIWNYSGSSVTIAVVNNTGTADDDYLNGVENGTVTLATDKVLKCKAGPLITAEGRWASWLSD